MMAKIFTNTLNIFITIILIQISKFFCQTCRNIFDLDNSHCFNNILVINSSEYRAGHFAKNKNNDVIVEYSNTSRRLFYGLHKSGKYYYESESHFKEKNMTGIEYREQIYEGRYESTNLFVSTISDINKEKEYLLSLSSYKALIEIYDIERDSIDKYVTEEVFGNGIFPYHFALFDAVLNNQNIYFSIYSHDNDFNYYQDGNYFSIKKFYFYENSDHSINVQLMKSSEPFQIKSCRMISGFIGQNQYIYAIFFGKRNSLGKYDLYISKYDYIDLECLDSRVLVDDIYNKEYGKIFESGIFKSIYLTNNLAALIYFLDESNINFSIFNLESNYNRVIAKDISVNIFPGHQSLHDLIKINNERLVFCTVDYDKIHFIFIDLYNNYYNIKFRYYSYTSSKYYFEKELSGYNYNDYFIFTITAVEKEKGEGTYNSLLMIFGYANGTDGEIDISPYLSDSDSYDPDINLVTKLLENITIDNNIFGYEIIYKIKLVNIPEEIKFYNMEIEQELQNDDILELNYKIKQNNELIKDYN